MPARTKTIADAYEYPLIASLVDRMVIMAYDEHWSTSAPGPIASLPWCASVADYAKTAVPLQKIVMGLPLYGRAWQDKQLARALRFENVQDLVDETESTPDYASERGSSFTYTETVVVSVFFDDTRSLLEKLGLYRARDIPAVSFWRIGQGPSEIWSSIVATPKGRRGRSRRRRLSLTKRGTPGYHGRVIPRKLTPGEITAVVEKIRKKYDEYIGTYFKPKSLREAFEERYLRSLRASVDISSFLLAEIGAIEELIGREEERIVARAARRAPPRHRRQGDRGEPSSASRSTAIRHSTPTRARRRGASSAPCSRSPRSTGRP